MSQPQSLTTESPAAAAVQQPPPVHVRDPIVATTRPTSPVSAASLNSSQSATTTLLDEGLDEGQEEEGDPNMTAAPMDNRSSATTLLAEGQEGEGGPNMTATPIELDVTPLHMLHQPR